MTRAFTLRSIIRRWPRLLVAVLVVSFGVATSTGALVFTDTTRAVLAQTFGRSVAGATAVISGRFGALVPDPVITRVRRIHGVRAALGAIEEPVTIVGADGAPVPAGRLANAAVTMVARPFSGVRLTAGYAPRGITEVAIDASTARQQGWHIGSIVRLLTGQPVRQFRVAGIAAASPAGQRFVVLSLDAEQRLYGLTGSVDSVLVATQPGYPARLLLRRLRRTLGPALVVRVRRGAVNLDVSRVSGTFSSLNGGLLAFAVVAVLVGVLTIYGTFSITAQQRAGELALLRALGALRRQVVAAGLLEGLIVGVLGTLIGILAGPFLALAIRALFQGGGFALPAQGLVLKARTAGVGVAVGVGISLLAALLPAMRATRAAPIEALRAAARAEYRPATRAAVLARAIVAAGFLIAGLVVMFTAAGDDARRLWMCGIGGALLALGALLGGQFVVSLAGRIWRITAGRARDAVPALAREHALVNPGRTALSGASLMIGVALAVVIGLYVGGLRAATDTAISKAVIGDVAIENADGVSSLPATAVRAAAAVPDITALSTLKQTGAALKHAGTVPIEGVDPTSWGEVYRFAWVSGSPQDLANLTPGEALVESNTARAAGLAVGSSMELTVAGGRRASARVAGIYRDPGLLRGVVLPLSWFDQLFAQQQRLQAVFVKLSGFVSRPVALAALRRALQRFPGVVARNQLAIASRLRARVDGVVRLLYALLVLTVVMSLLGIGGALGISVRARWRELGVLRALGMTPLQARRLVRIEGLMTVTVAALTGLVLGAVAGAAVLHALSVEGFSPVVPWAALAAALAAIILVVVIATAGPARRAARVDILAAIAYE